MTTRTAPPCPHDLRPGTTVCLRCQHAERGARRAKQRRLIARSGAAAMVLAVLAAAGIAGATALKGRVGPATALPTSAATTAAARAAASGGAGSAAGLAAADGRGESSETDTTAGTTAGAGLRRAAGIAPLVPPGRTALRDTMVAERAGDTVRVRFDRVMLRTRRPDKFERIMRSTLPQVYGAAADSALRALPAGAVTRAGDLTTTLPARGLHIPLGDGRTISVWPETREGRDGPLVVAYRTVASR